MGSSLTTLHIYSSLVPICDYFLGYLFGSTTVLYVILPPQKGTRESSHRRIRGSIIIRCAVWHLMTTFTTLGLFSY
jgi:hypothetical protein